MPVVTVYRHGVTAGVPPMNNDHQRALRDVVGGRAVVLGPGRCCGRRGKGGIVGNGVGLGRVQRGVIAGVAEGFPGGRGWLLSIQLGGAAPTP